MSAVVALASPGEGLGELPPTRRQIEASLLVRRPGTSTSVRKRCAQQALREAVPGADVIGLALAHLDTRKGRAVESRMLRGAAPTTNTAPARVTRAGR